MGIEVLQFSNQKYVPIGNKHTSTRLNSNFAVDNEGTVKLIDLENLVVVNKTRVRAVGAPGANVVHTRSGHFAICLLCQN